MERAWKVINLFIGLVLIGLCSGFPIGLENSAADYHTQFLTGLVGVLLTVCGVVFLAGCLCCQRKNGFKEFHNNPVVASSTSSLDHGHINPIANGEFTIFTPLSPPHHNNNVFLANEQIVGQTEIDYNHADIDVRSWFDGTENDFPRTRLKYIKELGKGWFGRVVQGTAQSVNDGDEKQNWTPVVVRILEASATSSERAVFLHDAVIYRCGKHPHILQLLGRSLESVPLLLLQELCPHGDLKKYLRDNRGTAEKLLSSDLPLLWCCQLSSALKHLHDHRLTHPDLAARNCQVVSDLSIKLGDYGLAASLYPQDYYEGAPAVPVRWCAPESLTYTSTTIQPKQITFESNVWSLGVTMWEIYECGAQPYVNLSDDDVLSQVLGSANVRLSRPEFSILYTDYIFRLMQLCWSTSESRPSVSQVHLMLTDLMQVYQNTKHITHPESLISIQDFDKRWETFKPNTVAKTDNQEFTQESMSMADIDLSDITILNLNLNKDEELSNAKTMSPSLNNLHGSLDNLVASGEMDSWLQKVATKTGDMSYVRGLSEAIKDLDNTLALENVSSSDSSHQPSPAPENLPKVKNKLEFKLGPTSNDLNTTQNSSLTESMQRTSSESETEDENWRRKIEQGAYSEKVHQKSKSVTDLMVLTHIDCSESDSETPLPSLDYRVTYKNVRYAPKQNLENVSLMFGSEGNLLSVHDKFQEELRRLQEERKDSLLFVPESLSHNDEKPNKQKRDRISLSQRATENSSSDEETWTVRKSEDATCTYVNINPSTSVEQPENSNLNNKNVSPNHRNPESLIEELSSPTDIQPGSQVYNIFNVSVDANFSPLHLKPNLKDIICYKDLESNPCSFEDSGIEVIRKNFNSESTTRCFQVPKLAELIQNNDDLMDYIITRYESQEDVNINPNVNLNISESKNITPGMELNNNIQSSTVQDLPSSSKSTENVHTVTQKFLQNEQQNYELPKVHFDISQTQEEVLPSSMTHSSLCTSTPFKKQSFKNFPSDENKSETLQFSSNFSDLNKEESKSEMKYSLETWDNFLGTTLDGSRECSGFDNFASEPQSLLFVDERMLNVDTIECKNQALIDSFNLKSENDLGLQADVNIVALEQNVNSEESKETEACSGLSNEHDLKEKSENPENENETFVVEQNSNTTYVCEDIKNENDDPGMADINDVTVVLSHKNEQLDERNNEETVTNINSATVVLNDKDEQLDGTYTKEHEGGSNWEPGKGWFLHPQTNSEVSGQMEVSQGAEESYVGFSMDDEIMAAIRNELLMKLPQAQGQSSEQVKDTDEWDTEGRSEVLIKYNVYTTPLSPIPEESYSENDSYHLIYNREDSSDSENEDWPEPYEEHNSGLGETETRSIQNPESPIPEPQNRHTPSQDSCCSNDTLFNLEELTFVVNENDNLKILGDLPERKGCDLFETNKTVLYKDLEEPTLKMEEETEKEIEQNGIKGVNEIPLETEAQLENVCTEECLSKKASSDEENILKNTNKFQTEIFTCNIEPIQIEALPKTDKNMENELVHEKNQKESSEEKVECKVNDTILVNLETNTNEDAKVTNMQNNQNLSEVSDSKKKKEEIDPKTDHTLFPEDDIVTRFLDHHENENKIENTDNDNLIEAINESLIAAVCNRAQDEEINVSNFNLKNCEISLDHNEQIIENYQVINEQNKLNLETSKVSMETDEVNNKKNTDLEEIAEENKSNIDKTFKTANEENEITLKSTEVDAKKYDVISKSEVVSHELEDIKKINCIDIKNSVKYTHGTMINEVNTSLDKHELLEKSKATTSQDELHACKSDSDLEKCEFLEKNEANASQDEVKACKSVSDLEKCEGLEKNEAATSLDEVKACKNVSSLEESEDLEKNKASTSQDEVKACKSISDSEKPKNLEKSEATNNKDKVQAHKNVTGIEKCEDLEKNEANISQNEDKACKSVSDLKKYEDLEKYEVTFDHDEVKACKSVDSLENCEDLEKYEATTSQDEVKACESVGDLDNCKPLDVSKAAICRDEVPMWKSGSGLEKPEDLEKSEVPTNQDEVEACKSANNLEKCDNLQNSQDEVKSCNSVSGLKKCGDLRKNEATSNQGEVKACKSFSDLEKYKDLENSEVTTNKNEIQACNTVSDLERYEYFEKSGLEKVEDFEKDKATTTRDEVEASKSLGGLEKYERSEVLTDQDEVKACKSVSSVEKCEDVGKNEATTSQDEVKASKSIDNFEKNEDLVISQVYTNRNEVKAYKSVSDLEKYGDLEQNEAITSQDEAKARQSFRSLEKYEDLHKSEFTTNQDEVEACKSVHSLETLEKSEATKTQDEVNACKSINGLENCKPELHEVKLQEDESFSKQNEGNRDSKKPDLINFENFEKNEGNIKEGKFVNGNLVAVSHGEIITGPDEIKNREDIKEDVVIASENKVIVSLDAFNNMEILNPENNKECEAAVKSKEVNIIQVKIISPQNTVNYGQREIDIEKFNKVEDEVDIKKNEVAISQDEVTSSHINGIDICFEKCEFDVSKHTVGEACESLIKLNNEKDEVDQENKQFEECKVNFDKVEVNTMQNEIKLNEMGLEKLEELKHQSEAGSNKIDEGKRDKENANDDQIVVIEKFEINLEKDQAGIEMFENTKDFENVADKKVNIVKVDVDQNLEGIEKNYNHGVAQNKIEGEDVSNKISTEKSAVANKGEVEKVYEHQMDVLQNGFYSDEVSVENINIGFIKTEDKTKSDDDIFRDEVEENETEINKFFDVEDLEKNDVSISKLNIKNMQNGMIPGNSPKWINKNDVNIINVFKGLNEVSTKNLDNCTSSQIRETSQAESKKTEGRMCDSTDISLIVENNPNYITEFLNHERHSISSFGSSRDDDSSDHVDVSLQRNQNFDTKTTTESDYANVDDITIKLVNEPADSASYVNTNELVNITSDFDSQPEYVNIVQEDTDEHLYDPVANEGRDVDIYDALTDIRFTGPTDIQLMSTSFSESADIDEQDWDSGSDTRSSSSGEFIWKEGEHEESVKALRAAPQDVIATEKLTPMEDIDEVSTESSEDEDGDSPEFVPSAWDKYATPTKSALRSPEKTLEKAEVKHKKPKGVWFKKQKYHCVYEYPREPETPNMNSFDLWQPVSTSLIDWEVDTSPYVPTFDGANSHPECYQQLENHAKNLYQLTDFTSGMTALDDEFFISSTARPFESFGGLSSQFFPGQTMTDHWMDLSKQSNENITPDSGVEDITPSNVDGNEFLQAPPKHQVQPLKLLATVVLKNNQISELKSNSKDALGGLRHARNKLKLDLPPSPSAFTSTKAFTIEPPEEPVTKREVPTFTTFGKSRFLVQHVDTPTCDEKNESKNVSFEALPYKPAQITEDKAKIEMVRGEASLLDSADEDSGIESSTLERKKITNVAD